MWLLDELEKRKESHTIAVIHRERKLTYKDLWELSERLACWIEQNCQSKAPIAIYGNKDVEIIIIMVASIKTGRAYVPLDVSFPVERVEKILQETESEMIFNFTQEKLIEVKGINVVLRSELEKILYKSEVYGKERISKGLHVKEEENCYILFTSGSTGDAKGVQITKKNILNFVNWFKERCTLHEDKQVVLNQVSYSFDVSVIPLYIYLSMGKTLYSIDKGMMDNLKELFGYLEKSDIAEWISTPAFMEICSFDDKFHAGMLDKLEKVILAGEVLTKKLVFTIQEKFPGIEIINGYGPTEGTVLLSACVVTQEMLEDEKDIPIGRILEGGEFRIVNDNGESVLEGKPGELVVVSNSISNGYFKNKYQTEEVFFTADNGKRGYHTGDIVFENGGLLYYVARKDTQIKLNGFRIELMDISSNLNRIDIVSNSVVLPVYKEERVSYIVAFVTLKVKKDISKLKQGIEIRNELRKMIPIYMVPRKIVIVDSFPMNTNGKIDRKKLMEEYL